MPLLVTSASGASGNGFGALLAFELTERSAGLLLRMIALPIRVVLRSMQKKICSF